MHDFLHLDLYATIGCHPTRSSDFDKFSGGPAAYLSELDKLIEQHMEGPGRVVAVGECGLGTTAAQTLEALMLIPCSRL